MCVPYTVTQLMLRVSTHTHNSFRMFVSSRVILRIRPEKTNVSFAVNRITLQLTLWFLKISEWTKTTDDSFHGEFHVPIQSANTHTQTKLRTDPIELKKNVCRRKTISRFFQYQLQFNYSGACCATQSHSINVVALQSRQMAQTKTVCWTLHMW